MLVEIHRHPFIFQNNRKDTLKSLRINLLNSLKGFKMSYTQLIKDTLDILELNIFFEKNGLTKDYTK